jgi:uncharacterized protein
MSVRILIFAATILCVATAGRTSSADILLSGTQYLQNFDGIGAGLPSGITGNTGATAASLGTAATFNTAATSWSTSTGQFANFASVTGLGSMTTTANQSTAADRAMGIRQASSFGDPGAAFTFQFHDTVGFKDFTLSFQSEMASVQTRSTTWNVEWALGALPTSFTLLGQITDPGLFGEAANSYPLPAGVNDQSLNLWIRVATLSAASGQNNRDTFSIDDFKLTYVATVPEASAALFAAMTCGLAGLVCGGRTAWRKHRSRASGTARST